MIAKIKTQHVTNLFVLYVIYFSVMQAVHYDEINYLSDSNYPFYFLIVGSLLSVITLFKKNFLTFLILLIVWSLNFWINPFAVNISTPVVGFFIILFMLQPLFTEKPKVFAVAVNALLIYMLARYFYFGINKLGSEYWIDGTVVKNISSTILARPVWSEIYVPKLVSITLSWIVILIETLSPLALLPKFRSKYLILLLALHIFIVIYLRFLQLNTPFIIGLFWFYLYEIEKRPHLNALEKLPV